MTTLAYNRGVFAWDSRITADGTIITDKGIKRFKQGGHVFFLCGATSDWPKFIDAFLTGTNHGDLSVGAFIVTPDKRVLSASVNDAGEVWTSELTANEPHAMGSGGQHAVTAMDCGLSPTEAVRMAIKRDSCSGGRVHTCKV